MNKTFSIKSIFEDKKKIFSVEFFPPKDEAGGERMLNTASLIQPHKPDFVSITYGAGGGTRSTTMRYAKILREEHGFEVMPHLTCVGHTRDELLEILEDFAEAGFEQRHKLCGEILQREKASSELFPEDFPMAPTSFLSFAKTFPILESEWAVTRKNTPRHRTVKPT